MKRGWRGLLGVAALLSGVACGSGGSLAGPSASLSGPFMLSGTVSQDGSGGLRPSRGAQVVAVFGAGKRSAETGESGRFIITGLPAGPVSVYVTKDGYDEASAQVELKGDLVLDFQLWRSVREPREPKVI